MPKAPEYEIVIDGEKLADILEDFTFMEQDEYAAKVRELSGESEAEPDLAAGRYKFPVVAWLWRRRKNSALTLDEVRESLKVKDVIREVSKNGARPTKARPDAPAAE